jgi:hypothetical protein
VLLLVDWILVSLDGLFYIYVYLRIIYTIVFWNPANRSANHTVTGMLVNRSYVTSSGALFSTTTAIAWVFSESLNFAMVYLRIVAHHERPRPMASR